MRWVDPSTEVEALRRRVAQLEDELRRSSCHAQAVTRIVDSIDHHLYINELTPDGGRRNLFAGPGRDRLLGGVPADGDWGRAWMAAVHPKDRPLYDQHTARYRRGEPSEVCCRM